MQAQLELGKETVEFVPLILSLMWICPDCNQKFVNRNQSHSCDHFTMTQFLESKPRRAVQLYRHFLSEYRKIGLFELHPVKTRIALLTKMRFCAIDRIGRDFIDIHLVLTKPCPGRSFRRIDNPANRFFVHHLRIQRKSDITDDVRHCMRLAYKVGKREHLKTRQLYARPIRGVTTA